MKIYIFDKIKKTEFAPTLILFLAGIFKFIEPFFYFIDNRNTFFMLLLVSLTLFLVLTRSFGTRYFDLKIILLFIACILLVVGDMGIPYSICVAISLSYLPLKKGLRILLISGLVFFALPGLLGINSEYIQYRYDGSIRYNLGFEHPNTPPTLFLILFSGFILTIDKHKIIKYILLSVLAIFIYKLTDSRTFLISLIATAIIALPLYFLNRWKHFYKLMIASYLIFTILSFLIGTVFNTEFFNQILSGRPYYFNWYITNGGISWISERFINIPENMYLDNLFLAQIYMVGVPSFVTALGIIYFGFKTSRLVYTNEFFYKISLSYFLLLIGSLSESFLTIYFCPAYIVLISSLFYKKELSFLVKQNKLIGPDTLENLKRRLYA